MGKVKTTLCRGVFSFFTVTLVISANLISTHAVASDDFSQYGLGAEAMAFASKTSPSKTLSSKNKPFEKQTTYQFAKDFHYNTNQKQDSNESVLQIDIGYEDKIADLYSPQHGFNSDLNNKFNHTSNAYKTRMDYRFKHLTSKAAFNYSPDSYGFGEYYNYELGFAVPIKDIFSLETRYGWNKFNKQSKEGGMNDYQNWSVGVSTTYKGMKLKVDYIDMNASENSQECKKSFPCEGKAVFSIIKDF